MVPHLSPQKRTKRNFCGLHIKKQWKTKSCYLRILDNKYFICFKFRIEIWAWSGFNLMSCCYILKMFILFLSLLYSKQVLIKRLGVSFNVQNMYLLMIIYLWSLCIAIGTKIFHQIICKCFFFIASFIINIYRFFC